MTVYFKRKTLVPSVVFQNWKNLLPIIVCPHLPYPSLSSPLLALLSLFSLSLGDDTKWPIRVDVSLKPNTINCPHLVLEYTPFHKFEGSYRRLKVYTLPFSLCYRAKYINKWWSSFTPSEISIWKRRPSNVHISQLSSHFPIEYVWNIP